MYVTQFHDFEKEIKLYEQLSFVLPDPPNKRDILNHNRPESEHKWRRHSIPKFWDPSYLRKEAESTFLISGTNSTRKEPDYNWWMTKATNEMVEYAQEEWEKRLNGTWVFIKGKPVYLTGDNYYYLQWYSLDDGYPDFRYRDTRWFYAAQAIDEDPKSLGMIYGKRRREGASFRGASRSLNYTSRTPNAMSGFQTKVGDQAAKDFRKIFTTPLSKMPAFFIPRQSGTEKSKEGIFFFPPTRRRTIHNSALGYGDESLESSLEYRTTVAEAFDGQKLHRYMIDEAAKMKEASFEDMWEIAKTCLSMRGQSSGKAYICSTIIENDEDEAGAAALEAWKTVWDQSNPEVRGPNGFTVSGLTRYFIPAYDGLEYRATSYFDEFGFSKQDEAKAALDFERDFLREKGQTKKLNFFIRQYPYTAEESTRPSAAASSLDHEKIIACLQALESPDRRGRPEWTNMVSRCDLVWAEGRDSTVKIVPSPNGRFYINQKFLYDEKGNPIQLNRVRKTYFGSSYHLAPLNSDMFQAGVDPVEANLTDLSSNYFSMASCIVMRVFDQRIDGHKPGEDSGDPNFGKAWETKSVMVEYMARPPKVEDFYEDMIKLCHLLSCPISVEKNKGHGMMNYFGSRGYGPFLDKNSIQAVADPSIAHKSKVGTSATQEFHSMAFDAIQTFVCDHCYPHRVPFPRLLNQLLKFNHENHRILDLYCAFEQCIMALAKNSSRKPSEPVKFEMPTYKIVGNRSVLK